MTGNFPVEVRNQFPSTKTECDYLNGWIKKRSHTQKSHPKVVNPRDIAGERKKKKKEKKEERNQLNTRTDWLCVSVLLPLEAGRWISNFCHSVAARTIVRAGPCPRYTSSLLRR